MAIKSSEYQVYLSFLSLHCIILCWRKVTFPVLCGLSYMQYLYTVAKLPPRCLCFLGSQSEYMKKKKKKKLKVHLTYPFTHTKLLCVVYNSSPQFNLIFFSCSRISVSSLENLFHSLTEQHLPWTFWGKKYFLNKGPSSSLTWGLLFLVPFISRFLFYLFFFFLVSEQKEKERKKTSRITPA